MTAKSRNKDVFVERRFQRSIRIDKDLADPNSLHGFICPPSFATVLTTVAEHVRESKQGAFTWTGPFGGGKSSLALVFSALLSGDKKLRKTAMELTGDTGKAVSNALKPGALGYRSLAVVGRKESPSTLLIEAMKREKGLYRESKKAESEPGQKVLESLERASKSEKHAGLVIFFDELGKVLEAAAEGSGDLHFLQDLAELASRSDGRLIVIGILHQSFGEYTGRMASRARDEWMKIQGRFVDIPLSMAAGEQLSVLSSAIQSKPPKAASDSAKKLAKIIDSNRQQKNSKIDKALVGCWPLSSVTAALLGPYSRRRFGQNQRSIFSFLNSSEPHAFQAFLVERDADSVYIPLMFWDYLRANVEPSIMASADGHRWSTALDAVERCEAKGGRAEHIAVAKTIAIVELFREQSGFYPSKDIITLALPELKPAKISECLEDLQEWSIVAYRKHIDSYAIHAGSDFDIDSALEDARNQQSVLDVATLNRLSSIKPILAMRHYHETGALRWMAVHVVSADDCETYSERLHADKSAMGHFLLVLPTAEIQDKEAWGLIRKIVKSSNRSLVSGVVTNGLVLNEVALELSIAERLQENRGELSGDAVARREVESRIVDLRSQFNSLLNHAFLDMQWHHASKTIDLHGRVAVNQFASEFADDMFGLSPKITSELLNREKPSSSGMRARRLLLAAMVENRSEARLGFQGFPAEAALYDSVLAGPGLHRQAEKKGPHVFGPPSKGNDPARVKPLWDAADAVLESASAENPKSMDDIYSVWRAAPYGVREGLLVVFGLAYLLEPKNDMAVYLDSLYRPVVDDFVADRLHQEPGAIALRKVAFSKARSTILNKLAELAQEFTDQKVSGKDPLQVAQLLVSKVMSLPPWTLRTRALSEDALKLRSIVVAANDPNRFLFDDLAQLGKTVGLKNSDDAIGQDLAEFKPKEINSIVTFIRSGVLEMSDAYPKMLKDLRSLLESELQFDSTKQGIKQLNGRAENIIDLTGDFRLDAYATRLKSYDDTDKSVESIASLAANKPARDWVDRDLDAARIELAELSKRFKNAEAFAHVKNRAVKRHSVALVLGLAGNKETLVEEFSFSDSDSKRIESVEKKLKNVLSHDEKDRDVFLAAFAKVGAELLSSKASNKQSTK